MAGDNLVNHDTLAAAIPGGPSRLWGIAGYFNPAGYSNKLEHLRLFADGVRGQGLKLLVVELAFEDAKFALDAQIADCVVRVRSSAVLWQKERLLNIAAGHLPDYCDRVVWLDTDILFENDDWVGSTSRMLEQYAVVQPYDSAVWLPPGACARPPRNSVSEMSGQSKPGLARAQAEHPGRGLMTGHPGFAWAARRGLISSHGLYDRFVLGGGDLAMCWAMFAEFKQWPARELSSQLWSRGQIDDVASWAGRFHADVRGSVSHVPGTVLHLWHGKTQDRRYLERCRILKQADFDPQSDIALDSNCCWRWNSDKPDLHRRTRDYFWSRKEEG
jgi:hypothetical protein